MVNLRQWLDRHGLGKHADLLAENEVDLEVLPELEEADLEKIGIPLGARKKLLKAIKELDKARADERSAHTTVPAQATGDAERRQLTVMFADLVGSTELSQRIDPEDLRDINRTYQDAAKAAVDKYDGYVARYMGDGVLAYFGYPRAHEDDAERAVRAGLELAEAVPQLETGVALAVRVGIATGPVVVGDIVGEGAAQESAVVGETPNLAARLEAIADPNSVMLSAATRHLVAGRFDLEALGPQTLKGIDEPVRAYRALAVREVSRFDAALERRLTPLVGRDEELGILLRRWQLAVDGEEQAVLLSGEAGVGKSRIVRALQDALADTRINRVLCFCSLYRQSSAFHPLIDQIERAARIGAGQTPQDKLDALKTLLDELGLDVEETVRYFAELLSIPYEHAYPALDLSPEQLRVHTLDMLVGAIRAMAVQAPVLFVVEDVHWIDPSTQDFLTRLIETLRDSRILVVVSHRPEYRPLWTDYSHVTALALNNLGRRDSAAMIAEVTKGSSLPEGMVEEIVARSDGVPLFIEEISAALADPGFIPEGEALDGPGSDVASANIPATLQDLLMERLDRLGAVKEVAQLGAVIGRSFGFDLLSSISGQDDGALQQKLAVLVQAGLIYGSGGRHSRYEFKHALVRDAAYQSLLKRERQRCHLRIASSLVQAVNDNPPLELVAHHFEEAGKQDEAARYWRRAGEHALGRFAHVEAISDFRRAIASVQTLAEEPEWMRFELETQTLLGPSLMYVSGQAAPEVEQIYVRALDLAGRLGDARTSFTSAWGLWRLQFARGDMRTAQEYASKCQQVSAGTDDAVAHLGTVFTLGATHLFSGRCPDAAPYLEASIELYRRMEDKSRLAVFGQDPGLSSLCYLAWAKWLLGFPDQAVVLSEEAVRLAREIGKPALIGVATGFAGLTCSIRRDIPKLLEYGTECKSICDQHEFRQHAAMSNIMLGYAYSHRDDHARASALVGEGIDEKVALHNHIALPWFCSMAAEASLAAGRLHDALEFARKGIDYAAMGGERFFEPENHRMLAVVRARDPAVSRDAIQSHFDDALNLARSQGARSLELRTAVSIARFAREQGEPGRARELLAPIHASFTEGFDTRDLQDAAALLGELT